MYVWIQNSGNLRKKCIAIHVMGGSESIVFFFSKLSFYDGLVKTYIFNNVIGFGNMTSMRSSVNESTSLQVPGGIIHVYYIMQVCVSVMVIPDDGSRRVRIYIILSYRYG